MKQFSSLIILFVFCLYSSAQKPRKALKKLGNQPALFVDSVNVSNSDLNKYNPNEITGVTVYKPKEAIAFLGEDGKDGAVYIETKGFAKKRYWRYFSSKSKDYLAAVPVVENDSTVQYILNKRILKGNFEGDLAIIDDKIFESITILSKEELEKQYGITDKLFGVLIHSKVPANLYHGKRKF